jgi:succinate dehydrogenase / fumarate reductase membrane anchor subunit
MGIRTPINRVRGLGSAKEGTTHFWHQRVTAVALVPLVLWFLWMVPTHVGSDYYVVREWLSSPLTATLLLLFIGTAFYHMKLGFQTVVEEVLSVAVATFRSFGEALKHTHRIA